MSESGQCELCVSDGGDVLWSSSTCRVVSVDDPDFPGFCRVIWRDHVREMTDLTVAQRQYLMAVVFAVEAVLRQRYSPLKINLASFGNLVPHLHWHVIPRWAEDSHFPAPIWGERQRPQGTVGPRLAVPELAAAMSAALVNLPECLS